jgi:cobalt-precorrin 5A hydrolase
MCYLPVHLAQDGAIPFQRVAEVIGEAFARREPLVCIMAAGIVVRCLCAHLQGKDRDPPVVVVDEAGQFAVSLLSGHLGGANDLARQVAALTGGLPVITTATDVAGLPAFDVLAVRLGLAMENLPAVREVHAALLQGLPVRVVDSEQILTKDLDPYPELFRYEADLDAALDAAGPAVYVGCQVRPWPPGWLILRPRRLVAGMGCHAGTPAGEILALIEATFREEGLALPCLKALATIAARKDEAGLAEAARKLGVEFVWFSREDLEGIAVPHPSRHAARHLGVASVSEAAALQGAAGGELVVGKRKGKNATLAVARVPWPSSA